MTLREFAVLDALNIASCREPRSTVKEGYWGTAEGISAVLATDSRFADYPKLSLREVGYVLRQLVRGYPARRAPLVEKVGVRHGGVTKWRLTDAACTALIA